MASSISISGTKEVGKTLTFAGTGSIDESYSKYADQNKSAKFRWTIAGTTKDGRVVTHKFSSPGTYSIKLKVYDGTFWSPVKSKSVTISGGSPPPPPPPPVCQPCPTCCMEP